MCCWVATFGKLFFFLFYFIFFFENFYLFWVLVSAAREYQVNKCNSFGVTRVAAINQRLEPELEPSNFGADYVARIESRRDKTRQGMPWGGEERWDEASRVETTTKLTILWANCDDVADFTLHLPHDCRWWVSGREGMGGQERGGVGGGIRKRMWNWKLEQLAMLDIVWPGSACCCPYYILECTYLFACMSTCIRVCAGVRVCVCVPFFYFAISICLLCGTASRQMTEPREGRRNSKPKPKPKPRSDHSRPDQVRRISKGQRQKDAQLLFLINLLWSFDCSI